MFSQKILETPFTSSGADAYFRADAHHIIGDPYNSDVSFLSTLRALVAPRMQENDHLMLTFGSSRYITQQIAEHGTARIFSSLLDRLPYIEQDGLIHIHSFESPTKEDNEACIDMVSKEFINTISGLDGEHTDKWVVLEKASSFFRRSFKVVCFINCELKSVFLFCDRLTMQKLHYLQCGIFAFLPWYFDPDKGVSELEMELIYSLREKDSAHYISCIAQIASQYDFRTARIRDLLSGFESRFEKVEIDRVKRSIAECISNIENWNDRISIELANKREYDIKLIGLTQKLGQKNEESEIMDFFLRNNNINVDNVNDSALYFSCWTYIDYFKEGEAEHYINNKNSYIYFKNGSSRDRYLPLDDIKNLMTAIFIDHTLKMRFCAAFKLPLNGTVEALTHHDYDAQFNNCMPNPHLDSYRCLGNNLKEINQIMQENDYVMAISQCLSACGNLNFGDSVVMEEFMDRICGCSRGRKINKCIELPDGEMVNVKGAIEWLNENKESDTAEEETDE